MTRAIPISPARARNARMRNERRRCSQPCPRIGTEQRPEIVEAFAARERRRIDAPRTQRLFQPDGARSRPRAAIAVDGVDDGTASSQRLAQHLSAAAAAKNHDALAGDRGEFRQREQAFAVHGDRRHAHVGDTNRGQRGRRAWTGCKCGQILRPGRSITDTILDGVGADEHRSIVTRKLALRLVERATVLRRQNDDRREYDRARRRWPRSGARGPPPGAPDA